MPSRALIAHATKSKMSPAQTLLELTGLEKRERDTRNLAERTKGATLGRYKALDLFDWTHPRAIERELFGELHETLGFIERGENVLFRGQPGVGKTTLAKNLGLAASAKAIPSAAILSLGCSPTCCVENQSQRSNGECAGTPAASC